MRPRVRAVLLTLVLFALPLGLAARALPIPMPEAASSTAPTLFVLPMDALPLPVADPNAPTAIAAPAPPIWPLVSGALALLMMAFAIGGLGYVALSAVKLMWWSRRLTDLPDEGAQARRAAQLLGAPTATRVRVVAESVTPCTYGLFRPTVVLPARLDADARTLALRHEIAHVRHGDAPMHLIGLACSSLAAWHPLAHLIGRRATLRREQAADAFALDGQAARRSAYARLLTHFSSAPALAPALAVPRHHLHNRLTAMTHSIRLTSPGRALPLALLLVLVALIALPLRAQVTPANPERDNNAEQPSQVPPGPINGIRAFEESITFPASALESLSERRVTVRFFVSEQGQVEDARAISSMASPLDGSTSATPDPSSMIPGPAMLEVFVPEAVRAIEALLFIPGAQRGQLARAEMEWTIRFFVDDKGEGKAEMVTPMRPRFADQAEEADVYITVEQQPRMLPNQAEAIRAMMESVVYPQAARAAGVEGRVIVQFTVDETGAVADPVVVRGVGSGLDEEAVRAIRTLRFAPGEQEGKVVPMQMALPVTFRLGGEKTGAATKPTTRSIIEVNADLIDRWRTMRQPSSPLIVTNLYGNLDALSELAVALRGVRSDLPLALVEGYVGAGGTRAARVVETDYPTQANAVTATAASYTRTDIGSEEYLVRMLILCPLVETGDVPASVRRSLEDNLDASHRATRYPVAEAAPYPLAQSYG